MIASRNVKIVRHSSFSLKTWINYAPFELTVSRALFDPLRDAAAAAYHFCFIRFTVNFVPDDVERLLVIRV
jgi:hypothetical protein